MELIPVSLVEVPRDWYLIQALNAIGIGWQVGHPPNGAAGTIRVVFDQETDAKLETLIGALADLRWRYEPGRSLQLALDLGMDNLEAPHGNQRST